MERLAPSNSLWWGWRRHWIGFLIQMSKWWCSNDSSARWSRLRPDLEMRSFCSCHGELCWDACLALPLFVTISTKAALCVGLCLASCWCIPAGGDGWGSYYCTSKLQICVHGNREGMEREQLAESDHCYRFLQIVLEWIQKGLQWKGQKK